MTNSIFNDLKFQFAHGSMVNRIIIINLIVFVAVNLVYILFFLFFQNTSLYYSLLHLFAVPSAPLQLVFQPWSVISYMFLHEGVLHILFNMLWLYWFGQILTLFLGDRKILPLYVMGGLAGAALFMLAYNFVPALKTHSTHMIGASAGVMSVVAATATLRPDYTMHLVFLGPVRLKYIALVAILIDVISLGSMSNTGGHISHLGGALFGYLFVRSLNKGNDWSRGFNNWMDSVANFLKKRRPGPRVVFKNQSPPKSRTKAENSGDQQQKIDAILDKIAEDGYDKLSIEEKTFLFNLDKGK